MIWDSHPCLEAPFSPFGRWMARSRPALTICGPAGHEAELLVAHGSQCRPRVEGKFTQFPRPRLGKGLSHPHRGSRTPGP